MSNLKAINDLYRHNQPLQVPLNAAFETFLSSGFYILGHEVTAFEKEFSHYCGVEFAIGVANGTDALEIGLRALAINSGDKVALAANAGGYGTIAVNSIGATPIYVDINLSTMTLDLDALKRVIVQENIKAIIVTHLYGRLADIEEIKQLALDHNIKLVEDCAQAHGAMRKGMKAGSFGDVACFSFYPTKNLGALGDGGAVITSDPAIAERVKQLRQYGWSSKYNSLLKHGQNSRLDELQAAILRIKLPHLDTWNNRRKEIAKLYNTEIVNPFIILPNINGDDYVAHLYVMRVKKRDSLSTHLKQLNVPHDIHYPTPDYKQPMFNDSYRDTFLSNTEQACSEVLTLPCFPEMTNDEALWVAAAVNRWES